MKKILVTGISGLVGSAVYLHLSRSPERYELYGLDRSRDLSERVFDDRLIDLPDSRYFTCDITDMEAVRRAVEGMDVVVHMAADPSGRSWESLRDNNLIGTYHIFEASREAGVSRIVAASTIQVSTGDCEHEPYRSIVEGREEDVPAEVPFVSVDTPGQPRNIYAASKVWSESLARVYGHSHGVSSLCIRIGWVTGEDSPRSGRADLWCSQRDIAELVRCCIEADPTLRFGIYYGMSDNDRRWVDLEKMHSATWAIGLKTAQSAHLNEYICSPFCLIQIWG